MQTKALTVLNADEYDGPILLFNAHHLDKRSQYLNKEVIIIFTVTPFKKIIRFFSSRPLSDSCTWKHTQWMKMKQCKLTTTQHKLLSIDNGSIPFAHLPCSSARLFNLQPIYLFHNKLFLSAIYQLLILPIQFLYWYLAQGYIYMFCMILFEFTY